MKDTIYIGIDPGKTGFITIFDYDNQKHHFFEMPYHKVPIGELTKSGKPQMKSEFHEYGLLELSLKIRKHFIGKSIKIGIEEVGGRGGWSATNNFNFGYTAGLQKMLALIISQDITMIRPQKWQSVMREGYKQIKKKSASGKTMINDAKAMAELIVKKEWPNIDFRKTERSKNNDDNKIDSFLICMYMYRTDKR